MTISIDSLKRVLQEVVEASGTNSALVSAAKAELDDIETKHNYNQQHLTIPLTSPGFGGSKLTEANDGNYTTWVFGIADVAKFTTELPYSADTSHDVAIHFTWIINEAYATASGEIDWSLDWSLTPHNETEDLTSPTHIGTLTTGDVAIPATANTVAYTKLQIPAADISEEDILGISFSRNAVANAPTADPHLVSLHIEFVSHQLGTTVSIIDT